MAQDIGHLFPVPERVCCVRTEPCPICETVECDQVLCPDCAQAGHEAHRDYDGYCVTCESRAWEASEAHARVEYGLDDE